MSTPVETPKFTLSWKSVTGFLRQAAAIVGLIVSIGNTDHLPVAARSVLLAISGSLLAAEHYAQAQSPAANVTVTQNTPPPTPTEISP